MKRLSLVLAFLIASIASASATCTGPAVMHDFAGTPFNMSLATMPDGNCGSDVAAVAAQATVAAGNSLSAVVANTTGTSIPAVGYGSFLFNVNCSVNCSGGTAINFQALDIVGTAFAIGGTPVTGASGMVTGVTNQSGSAQFCVPNFGYSNVRANVASYSAGTVSVTITPFNGNSCNIAQVANTTTAIKGSSPVVNGAEKYQLFAASSGPTTFSAPSSGGATGDYLSHCTVVPTTTSPGVVTILDNTTAIYSFPGGASSLSNLVPWAIPIGAASITGAWKMTLGAGVSMVCEGA